MKIWYPELLKFVVRNTFRRTDYFVMFNDEGADQEWGRKGAACLLTLDCFVLSWAMPMFRLGQLALYGVWAVIAFYYCKLQPQSRLV